MLRLLLTLYLFLPQSIGSHELINRVSEKYGRLSSLSAEFEQVSISNFSNQRGQYRGHVYLKTGKRALFQYDSPVKKSEYFDGRNYTVYTPEVNQATRCPVSKALDDRLVIFLILGNRESPWRENFPTMSEGIDSPVMGKGNRVVKLIPRNKDIPEVLIEVDPVSFLIQRFVLSRPDGNRDEFKFTNINTSPLEDSRFKFVASPDVEVVEHKVC